MFDERRKKRRSEVVATIVLDPGSPRATYYTVRNLSAGGALLAGQPVPPVGAQVRVALNLRTGSTVSLEAHVIRREPLGDTMPTFAIAFRQVSADAEDLIHDAVLAELELSCPGAGSDTDGSADGSPDS